jgi:phosphatidylserine decarboxylase
LKLARQGRREILLGSLLLLAACAVSIVLFWPLAVVPLALWLWVLWFFRDPDRPAPQMSAGLVSPADGHISDITPIGPESELGRPGVRIGIFMSVFDVHVNRSPAPARVESVVHRKGAFLDARDPQASERNESATIRLTCNRAGVDYPLVVRQVAGLLARRIVTELAPGQSLLRGQRIGMIKFGSRVEVLAPPELAGKIFVELGQKVLAGQTVLAAGMSEPGSD